MKDGLQVSDLHRSYGRVEVLRGVDLDVPAATMTAVVGPSGCGKTTLLRVIAGFDRPASGTVTVDGLAVTGPDVAVPPEHRHIGYVTQDGNLFPHLTVAGNITFGLPRRDRRARRRVVELLELLGLDASFADRRPHELSGGQQQRIALARALAPGARVVLLDEPFSALDPELRASTRRAVADALAASGTTALLVTHDRGEAFSVADHVAVMREGRIAQAGTPTALYRQPVDRGVAAFLGDLVELPARRVDGGIVETVLGTLPGGPATASGAHPGVALVRPEQIVLAEAGPGAVPAEVVMVEFFGPHAVVALRLPGGQVIRARCHSHLVPAAGDKVGVRVTGTAL